MRILDGAVRVALAAGLATLTLTSVTAQSPVSGVFFAESFESGVKGATFNSRNYGNSGTSPQFRVQNTTRAVGNYAFEHVLTPMAAGSIHYATQHIGDAVNGPVHAAGQGQHFFDLYVQFKVYYSANFDLVNSRPKSLIIGTEDGVRRTATCCNPWVSHYVMMYPPGPARLITVAEANAKQATTGQFNNLVQNRSGFSGSNPFVTQTARWYTVEVRRRLNDPGQRNGIFQMWVDGTLIAEYTNVLFRVPFDGTFGSDMSYGTNFVMISDYMNDGSTQNQSVFFDDFKFSTTPIGTGQPQTTLPMAPANLRLLLPPGF